MSSFKKMLAAGVLAVISGLLPAVPDGAEAQEIEEPAKGMFLVASRTMQDPRFRESVILLLSADSSGAVGLIINKPTDAKVSEFVPDMRSTDRRKDRVYFGGPVGEGQLLMLLRAKKTVKDAVQIVKGVSVTSSREVLLETVKHKKAGDEYRMFIGYSGWAAGQLEWELKLGQWHLLAADAASVFNDDETKVWPLLIRKSEEIMVQNTHRNGFALADVPL